MSSDRPTPSTNCSTTNAGSGERLLHRYFGRELVDSLHLIPLTDGVLAEAESIVPHVKTLDAIHLASAIATGLDVTLVTHDARMAAAAAVIGYPVFDPIEAD